jgi:YidC/Oxa1 family membrane protein insertase
LREKYKNDQARIAKETQKIFKEVGANPLSGCLVMLPQMPIIFALYNLLSSSIDLRQAPFALWITDLSMPDEVMIGGFGLHVLPILVGLSMFVQMKQTMKDPKQAFLPYLMSVFMTFFFYGMSSGLNLYWMVFNILTIVQQQILKKPGFGADTVKPLH